MRSTFVLSGTLTDRPCDSWLTGTPMRCDARCSTTSDVATVFSVPMSGACGAVPCVNTRGCTRTVAAARYVGFSDHERNAAAPNARPVEPAGPPLLSYRGQPTGEHAARTVLPVLPHSRTSVLLADSLYSSGASSLVRR